MLCAASYGDIEVMVEISGAAPLDQGDAVKMIAQQLDRLKSNQMVTAPNGDPGIGGQHA